MFRSIRWRLIISYIFLALLVVGVIGSLTFQLAKNYAANRELQGLKANAQAIALQAEPLMYSTFAQPKLQQLSETSAFMGDVRVRIMDLHQRVIADSGIKEKSEQAMILVPGLEGDLSHAMMFYHVKPGMPLEMPGMLLDALPSGTKVTIVRSKDGPWGKQFAFEEMVVSETDRFELDIDKPDHHYRSDSSIILPIGDPGGPIGFVELSEPLDYGSNLLDQLKQALVTAGVGAVVLAVIFGLWNSYRIAAPIKSLANKSAQMGSGNLSIRADLDTGGEIGALGDQFNQMADNLQATIQQLEAERDALRRFIADASHELRTPITALKNFNTLMQGPAASDPAAQLEFLSESQVQIERLAWITANLLDLSRLDAGLFELDLSEQDLRDIVIAAISPFQPLAVEKQISLVSHLPDHPVPISADRPRLEMAVGNLLDNAIKFTPENGEVGVTLTGDQDKAILIVNDTGEGIPSEDLPFIFERFYRGRTHSLEGSGLGLAIAKSVIEAHSGTITVDSTPGEGTTFTIVWD